MNSIIGSGGGGKSGSGSGGGLSEDPDTLSSVAFARFVDLIAEGPIVGLVNGDYSIYLDGVPLRNLEGTPNYRPFQYKTTLGTQDQLPIPGFAGTQSEVSVGVAVPQVVGKIIRSIPDADADSVRVTISVNGLSKTDTTTGKVQATELDYKIWVRIAGGTWVLGKEDKFTGKTLARYQRSNEIPLATLGAGPYEVAVERITPDSTSGLLINAMSWDSYAVINYEQFAYPNSALVAVELDGRYFSQVPQRGYHVKGLIVRVPSNYDPVTREYDGIWDGTFKLAYTNNPAWCFYDLCTSTRYGLGKRIDATKISKWSLYKIGQYCDQMVPTGLANNIFDSTSTTNFSTDATVNAGVPYGVTNLEPRFTLNCVINTKDDAYKVLNLLASVFRAMPYWGSNQIVITQDAPATQRFIWTNGNVIGGLFNYEGSARSQRHTSVDVGWNDPSEDFVQKFEHVEDREGIARYGVRNFETVAFGCTSRSQARRWGLWILYTERLETNAITFTTGMDSATAQPGDIGVIMDAERVGARWGGRVKACSTATVQIDQALALTAGSYNFQLILKDGSVVTRPVNITTGGTFDTLNFATPLPDVPTGGAIWAMSSTVIAPMYVRVVAVKPSKDNQFGLTVLEHNPSKYDAIELGVALDQHSYSLLQYNKVGAITGLVAQENSYKTALNVETVTDLNISFDPIVDVLLRGYRIKVVGASAGLFNIPEQQESSLTLYNVTPDLYTVTVYGVNHLGITGPAAVITVVVTGVDSKPPPNVTNFNSSIVTGGVFLSWDSINDKDYFETEIHSESTWSDATMPIFRGAANRFTWPHPAAGTYTLVIKHRDTSGNESVSAASTTITVTPEVAGSADWTTLANIPANLQGLTGTEAILNSLLQPSVTALINSINNIASDNVLTPGEKPTIIQDYTVIINEQANIDAEAVAYGITSQKATYDTAIAALTNYLGTLAAPVSWDSLSGDTNIVGTTLRSKFIDVYQARQVLLSAIATISGTTAVWTTVTGAGKPADNASADITLVNDGGMTITGNTARKIAGTFAWDSAVHSVDSFTNGAFVSFSPLQTGGHMMIGLNSDPGTDNSYASIDYAWYCIADGTCNIYLNGVVVTASTSYGANDVFFVAYDGVNVRFVHNGVVVYTLLVGPGLKLFLDSSFYTPNVAAANLRFGPLTTNDWSAIGGTGRPADNATVGGTLGTNIGGQITTGNAGTLIAPGAIGAAQVGVLTAGNLTVGALSDTVNGGVTSGARVQILANLIRVYDSSNVLRVKLGNLA